MSTNRELEDSGTVWRLGKADPERGNHGYQDKLLSFRSVPGVGPVVLFCYEYMKANTPNFL